MPESAMSDTTYRRPIEWQSFAITDAGCVREVNEDAIFTRTEDLLWAVADGMGGHKVGDVASARIAEALAKVNLGESLSDAVEAVEMALLTVNQDLLEYARRAFGNQTMGSTAVCLLIKQHVGVCLWAGDSRLYRFRNRQVQQLTRDHSQVEEMLQMGLISEEEARHHPHRNVITRAVGVERDLFIDINVFSTQIGDTFMLCSDGLYNAVPHEQIGQALIHREAEACAVDLMRNALANGADDNVSVIVIKGEAGRVKPAG